MIQRSAIIFDVRNSKIFMQGKSFISMQLLHFHEILWANLIF